MVWRNLIAACILVYVGFIMLRSVHESAIFVKPDRINVAFYGEEAIILSFGLTDEVNYIVSLSHEQKIFIPGGYNQYPLGSLGKLVELQKDPKILQRTFSSMISGHAQFYVSPKHPDVYQKPDTDAPKYTRKELISKIFSGKYQTNMNVFDKFYVAYLISKRRQQDYVVLRSASEKTFLKKYKGFFYQQSLREEGKEVQIKYDTYRSALTLSRVIEGQGIRVVDLSSSDRENDQCVVRSNLEQNTPTVRFLTRTFACQFEKGDTEGVDIIIYLGKNLEKIWE